MKTKIVMIGSMLPFLTLPVSVIATDYTWNGSEDSLWTNENNWDSPPPGGGFPQANTDTAAIPNSSINPVVNTNITVGTVRITGNTATVTVGTSGSGTRDLLITDPDGLTIAAGATLIIQRQGVVEISGGGRATLDGTGMIEFTAGSGSAATPGKLVISKHLVLGPRETSATKILGTDPGIITGGNDDTDEANKNLLILSFGAQIRGLVTIEVNLINNGQVIADTAGSLILTGTPKMGDGCWEVVEEDAVLVVNTPVTGSRCAVLIVSDGDGTLDINANWISCGVAKLVKGTLDIASPVRFEMGKCSTIAGGSCTCEAQ